MVRTVDTHSPTSLILQDTNSRLQTACWETVESTDINESGARRKWITNKNIKLGDWPTLLSSSEALMKLLHAPNKFVLSPTNNQAATVKQIAVLPCLIMEKHWVFLPEKNFCCGSNLLKVQNFEYISLHIHHLYTPTLFKSLISLVIVKQVTRRRIQKTEKRVSLSIWLSSQYR